MFCSNCSKKFHKIPYLICFIFFYNVFLPFISVDATHFVQTHKKILNMPRNNTQEAQVQFIEGTQVIRFATKKIDNGTFRLLSTGKPNWIGVGKEYWRYQDYPIQGNYPDFIVIQYKDIDTGRFFYGISCILYGEKSYRGLIVGLNDDRKIMNTYIDSDNLHKNISDEVFIFDKNGNLYMEIAPKSLSKIAPGYRLYWSNENNWFGYEYVNNVRE